MKQCGNGVLEARTHHAQWSEIVPHPVPHLVRQAGGDACTRVPSGVPSAVGPQMNSQIHWVLKGQTLLACLGHTGERPRAELAPPHTRATWHARERIIGSR